MTKSRHGLHVIVATGLFERLVDRFQLSDQLWCRFLGCPSSQFPPELCLRPEHVSNVLPGERGDHEATTRNQTDETFAAQRKEPLAHRRVADTHRFGDGLEPEKLARSDRARKDEFSDIRG